MGQDQHPQNQNRALGEALTGSTLNAGLKARAENDTLLPRSVTPIWNDSSSSWTPTMGLRSAA